jgi:hypothetical protein
MNVSRDQLEKGPVRLEVDGLPAVVMSLSDYEDLLDANDPEVRASVAASEKDYREGRFRPVEELLRELGSNDG